MSLGIASHRGRIISQHPQLHLESRTADLRASVATERRLIHFNTSDSNTNYERLNDARRMHLCRIHDSLRHTRPSSIALPPPSSTGRLPRTRLLYSLPPPDPPQFSDLI